jgi:hypothetical protein
LKSKWVTDCHDQLTLTDTTGIAERGEGGSYVINFEHGEVCRRIVTDRICDVGRAIDECRAYFPRAVHDVAIGKQEAVGGEKETRARARRLRWCAAAPRDWNTCYLQVHDGWANTLDRADYRA